MTTRNTHHGFTLIEMLVAITIFAVVAAISYSSLSNALLVRERTEEFHHNLTELQLAIQIMDKDFRQIINRPIRDPFGGTETLAALRIGSNDSIVDFTHSGWPNPLHLPRSELRRVAYLIEDQQLVRQHWQYIDRESSSTAISTTLIEGVENLTVTVIDQNDEVQQFWPIDNSGNEDQTSKALPKGIEVTIEHQEWGEIRRVYEVVQ